MRRRRAAAAASPVQAGTEVAAAPGGSGTDLSAAPAERVPAAAAAPEKVQEAPVERAPAGGAGAAGKPAGKRAAVLEAAQRGELPAPPDFSANTHRPFREKLEQVQALVEAGDVAGLRAVEIKLTSSSPRAIARYRELAVVASEMRCKAEDADAKSWGR